MRPGTCKTEEDRSWRGCPPCVCVVALQLIIVALKGSVVLHLYAEENCLLQDISCMVKERSATRDGEHGDLQALIVVEWLHGSYALVGAPSELLASSQAVEEGQVAASA